MIPGISDIDTVGINHIFVDFIDLSTPANT